MVASFHLVYSPAASWLAARLLSLGLHAGELRSCRQQRASQPIAGRSHEYPAKPHAGFVGILETYERVFRRKLLALFNKFEQGFADLGNLLALDAVEKRQRKRSRRLLLGHRQPHTCRRERSIGGLQVDGRKIPPASDPSPIELMPELITLRDVKVGSQSNHIDEPANDAV